MFNRFKAMIGSSDKRDSLLTRPLVVWSTDFDECLYPDEVSVNGQLRRIGTKSLVKRGPDAVCAAVRQGNPQMRACLETLNASACQPGQRARGLLLLGSSRQNERLCLEGLHGLMPDQGASVIDWQCAGQDSLLDQYIPEITCGRDYSKVAIVLGQIAYLYEKGLCNDHTPIDFHFVDDKTGKLDAIAAYLAQHPLPTQITVYLHQHECAGMPGCPDEDKFLTDAPKIIPGQPMGQIFTKQALVQCYQAAFSTQQNHADAEYSAYQTFMSTIQQQGEYTQYRLPSGCVDLALYTRYQAEKPGAHLTIQSVPEQRASLQTATATAAVARPTPTIDRGHICFALSKISDITFNRRVSQEEGVAFFDLRFKSREEGLQARHYLKSVSYGEHESVFQGLKSRGALRLTRRGLPELDIGGGQVMNPGYHSKYHGETAFLVTEDQLRILNQLGLLSDRHLRMAMESYSQHQSTMSHRAVRMR